MYTRRLLIVYHTPLFGQGLRNLLVGLPGLEVFGMDLTRPHDEAACNEIEKLEPDVVILEEGDQCSMVRLLEAAPGSQLIGVSLTQNRARVYACREIERRGVEGIIETVADLSKTDQWPRPISE